jgi:septal ring factor EnvC (AmiA/AmiB activator)
MTAEGPELELEASMVATIVHLAEITTQLAEQMTEVDDRNADTLHLMAAAADRIEKAAAVIKAHSQRFIALEARLEGTEARLAHLEGRQDRLASVLDHHLTCGN